MNLRAMRLLLKHQGLGWAAYRARNALEHKLGFLKRRTPMWPWSVMIINGGFPEPSFETEDQIGLHWREHRRRFLFDPSDCEKVAPLLRAFDGDDPEWPARRLDEIESGRLSYFSNPPVEVGFPPKWNDNLLEGRPGPAMIHFSKIDEFGCGDVKCIWEPNRFGFAFDLVRIYWRTGEERAAELFWRAVEHWHVHNPPNTGINWKCGQESSLRAMAWCFGLWGFSESEHTTNARIFKMYMLLAATAERVEAHINYAVSQKNNHGVSEAMGLFTIGTLFPEITFASRWQQRGRELLESQARELIDDEGGFSQYSANYHRVMLHDYTYAIRIGEVNDAPLSDELKERVARAGRFLERIQDVSTGSVPRYGNDDGALILPLTNCDYSDFRPVTQSVAAMSGRVLPWPAAGEWNEEMLWLGFERYADPPRREPTSQSEVRSMNASRSEAAPTDFRTSDAGCQVLRSGGAGMAMMRAGGGRFRPAQLDQLHVDIWHRGVNVALDPGTYSYNAAGDWADIPLAATAAHNTVMIDGVEQAERISRFLYLPPPAAKVERFERSAKGHIAAIEATLDVYRRLPDPVSLRRALIQLGEDHWLVIDAVAAGRPHDIALAWNLPDLPHHWSAAEHRLIPDAAGEPYTVALATDATGLECNLKRAEENDWRGWCADRYRSLKPCLRLEAKINATRAVIATLFGPGETRITMDRQHVRVTGEGRECCVELSDDATDAIAGRITMNVPLQDELNSQRQGPSA